MEYMPPERKDNSSKFLLPIPLIKFFRESGVLNVDLACFLANMHQRYARSREELLA